MRKLIPVTRLSPALLAALPLLFSIACGTVQTTRTLRDAQQSFNEAATADTQMRTASDEATVVLLGARSGGYRTTIDIIDGFDAEQRTELTGNKLWGNALMLKAMSLWRLERNDEAVAIAGEATSKFPDQLGTRDAAILKVLEGLIAIDQANARLVVDEQGVLQCSYNDVNDLVSRGLSIIETGRDNLSKDVPVERYLLQAKLAGHRNRQEAEDCSDGGQPPSQEELAAKKKDYCALAATGEDAKVMLRWHGLLGLPQNVCR